MPGIADLPMLHDIDGDYTPQYVKLARLIRDMIESGQYQHGDALPAADLVREHGVSIRVAWSALGMLAANRYVTRPGNFRPYGVTWHAGTNCRPTTPLPLVSAESVDGNGRCTIATRRR
jgi:DNA-binding FadR family transcriptional regulator